MGTIFQEIAALKWPNYSIDGNGALAVVIDCDRRVVLTDDITTARAGHKIVNLMATMEPEPVRPMPPFTPWWDYEKL